MKKMRTTRKSLIAALLLVVLLTGTANGIGNDYKTYDPETGKLTTTGSRLTLTLDTVVETARAYNPSIRSSAFQSEQIGRMTEYGGMYADQVVANANATYYSLENALGKMSYASQTMIYSYYSLESSLKSLSFNIEDLERNEKKMKKMFDLGMISQDAYNEFLLSVKEAKASQTDLTGKRDTLLAQIAAYVNRNADQIEIAGFQLLSSNEILSRMDKVKNSDYEDAVKVSMDILAAQYAYDAAYENDYDDVITSLKLLETENNHQMNFETLKNDAILQGDKVKIANERYSKKEKDFAVTERRYQLGELSKMEYDTAVGQLHKDYITMMEAHIAFDSAYRKFAVLKEKGIFMG